MILVVSLVFGGRPLAQSGPVGVDCCYTGLRCSLGIIWPIVEFFFIFAVVSRLCRCCDPTLRSLGSTGSASVSGRVSRTKGDARDEPCSSM